MVSAEKVALSAPPSKLRGMQHVCGNGGPTVSTTIVEVIETACADIVMMRKNAALSDQRRNMETELVEARAGEGPIQEHFANVEGRLAVLTQLVNA